MKQRYKEGVSVKDKKIFAPILAEDEELVLATGYGSLYMRQMFLYYTIVPGIVFILGGLGAAFLFSFNLGIGMGVGLIIAVLIALARCHMLYNSHRYLLTTRRVIIKSGFFSVKLQSALYDKVTHIELDQSLFDRWIMHHGSIVVNTAGTNKNEIRISFIDSPIEFKNILERLINRERERYGRQQGAVITVEGEIVE